MDDFCVIQTHPQMLAYVDGLQKKNAEQLSFYPKQVFEREMEKGRIFLAMLNGEPCGYIYVGALKQDVKCHQVCIQYDARLKRYGEMLVAVLEDYATMSHSITLRCGFDLEANSFWKSLGYQCVAIHDGGIRRMRKINVWRKQLQPELFPVIKLEAARGKANSSVWRKNKNTGVTTQFARGKKLSDYRAMVLNSEALQDDL